MPINQAQLTYKINKDLSRLTATQTNSEKEAIMPSQSFMPCRGIDNTSEDAAMVQGGREPFVYMRDVVNANVTPAGKLDMIASGGKVTDSKYHSLWQSPLHKDVSEKCNFQK